MAFVVTDALTLPAIVGACLAAIGWGAAHALVLTGVGALFLKGSQLLQDAPGVAAVSRYLPAVSAMVIFILGVGTTVEAVWRLASVV